MKFKESITNVYDEIVWKKFLKLARELQTQNDYHFENEELFYHVLSVRGSKLSTSEFERLEYLGDSIYGAVVGLFLYENYPDFSPEELTNYRSRLVRNSYTPQLCEKLGLHEVSSILQTGNLSTGQKADLFEAYLGAVFKDTGFNFNKTKDVISPLLEIKLLIEKVSSTPWQSRDVKGFLNTQISKKFGIGFEVLYSHENSGPANAPQWKATLAIKNSKTGELIDDLFVDSDEFSSKKDAEKDAAAKLLTKWDEEGVLVE